MYLTSESKSSSLSRPQIVKLGGQVLFSQAPGTTSSDPHIISLNAQMMEAACPSGADFEPTIDLTTLDFLAEKLSLANQAGQPLPSGTAEVFCQAYLKRDQQMESRQQSSSGLISFSEYKADNEALKLVA